MIKKKLLAAAIGAATLVAGATMSHAFADTKGPTPTDKQVSASKPAGTAKPVTVAQAIESGATVGRIDGKSWSVSVKYYPKVPKGFPSKPGVSTADATVLCTRVMIGGVRVDEKGGRWADCGLSTGTPAGGAGLYGLVDKGLTGTRVFVGTTTDGVTRAVVTLVNGKKLAVAATEIPKTPYRLFAVPIAAGQKIAAVDRYVGSRRVSHDTFWR